MSSAVRAAGFIIYRQMRAKTEYLMMQTSYGEHHWTPPKGHVDPGESDYETAVRETAEEAGITEDDMEIDKTFQVELNYEVTGHIDGVKRPKVATYWLGKLRDPGNTKVTLSDEHRDFKWLDVDAACKVAKFEDMKKALCRCQERIDDVRRD